MAYNAALGYDPDINDYSLLISQTLSPTERANLTKQREAKIQATGIKAPSSAVVSTWAPGYTPGGWDSSTKGYTDPAKVATINPYMANYSNYAQNVNSMGKAQEDSLYKQSEAAKANQNMLADQALKESYINYKQNQRQLPSQLSSMGVTGGGTESANLALQAGYEGNRNKTELARSSALQEIENAYGVNLANLNQNIQSQLINAYQTAAANDTAYQQNAKEGQRQDFTDTVGQYANDYQAAIDALSASNDPDKAYKIGVLKSLRQQKIAGLQTTKQTSSKSSSGSSSGGNSGGSSTGNLYDAMTRSGNPLLYLSQHYKDYGLPSGQINNIYEDYLLNGAEPSNASTSSGVLSSAGAKLKNDIANATMNIYDANRASLKAKAMIEQAYNNGLITDDDVASIVKQYPGLSL